jgi:hypothetical protein
MRDSFCGGAAVRVVGLFLMLLAGPALASDERHAVGLARFAYANTSAFQTSFADMSLEPPAESIAATKSTAAAHSTVADLRPMTFVDAESLPDQPLDSTERAFTLSADQIEAVPLVRDIELLPAAPPAPVRLAALPEPSVEIIAEDAILSRAPHRKHAHSAHASHRRAKHFRARTGRNRASKPKVPRWARKMFDVTWQTHAFAYQ